MGSNLKLKVRVLILDDEPSFHEIYEEIFKDIMTEYSFDCFHFQHGDEAFEFIRSENKIDIFITDQRHPGKSTGDLVDYMDKNHPQTKTLIITGYKTCIYPNIDEARNIVYQKPIKLKAFTEKIRSLLNQYQEK